MKLRFRFRVIDSPRSIAVVEVDPAKLSQAERNLIADRLEGIDVCQLNSDRDPCCVWPSNMSQSEAARLGKIMPLHIKASGPEFADMMKAIILDEERLAKEVEERNRIIRIMFSIGKVDDSLALVDHYLRLFAVLPAEYELAKAGPGVVVAFDKASGCQVPWKALPPDTPVVFVKHVQV